MELRVMATMSIAVQMERKTCFMGAVLLQPKDIAKARKAVCGHGRGRERLGT
jgi:hypothetical protein